MAISSGNEATNLLRLSERIQGDLEYCLKNSEPMNLIVREFVNFPVKNELRGFVYKGNLLRRWFEIAIFLLNRTIRQDLCAFL